MSWANRTGESRRILAEAKGHKFLHRLSMGQRFRQSPEKPKWGLKKLRKFTSGELANIRRHARSAGKVALVRFHRIRVNVGGQANVVTCLTETERAAAHASE